VAVEFAPTILEWQFDNWQAADPVTPRNSSLNISLEFSWHSELHLRQLTMLDLFQIGDQARNIGRPSSLAFAVCWADVGDHRHKIPHTVLLQRWQQ
jgi:hypothetical protein